MGTVKAAQLLGVRRQKEFLDNIGLLSRPEVVFPGVEGPILPEDWTDLISATVSYGHGLAVTPLALATAYTAFANDGEIVRPRLLEPSSDQEIEYKRVMSAPTAKIVTQMLRETVLTGTGTRADVYGYEVAGKTGTAEKPIPGGYDYDRNICTFVSVFPASRPEYVVLITLDEPKALPGEGKTAALNAAPISGRLIGRIASKLGVEPVLDHQHKPQIGNIDARTVSDKRAL